MVARKERTQLVSDGISTQKISVVIFSFLFLTMLYFITFQLFMVH